MRIARKRNYPWIILIEINLKNLLALLIMAGLIFGTVAMVRGCRNHADEEDMDPDEELEVEELEALPEGKAIPYYTRKMSYRTEFADLNDTHLEAARAVGLKQIPESRDEIERNGDNLVLIQSNKLYKVDSLTYSVPYLTRGGADLLSDISKAFRDSLKAHDLPQYRIVVTSVLRTEADVKRLRRSGNVNATEDSAHRYGTTFDLSYVHYDKIREGGDYMQPYDLTKILAEVLRDLRNEGRLYCKYEYKQHCFHITSRR